jgi:hypothetical protein
MNRWTSTLSSSANTPQEYIILRNRKTSRKHLWTHVRRSAGTFPNVKRDVGREWMLLSRQKIIIQSAVLHRTFSCISTNHSRSMPPHTIATYSVYHHSVNTSPCHVASPFGCAHASSSSWQRVDAEGDSSLEQRSILDLVPPPPDEHFFSGESVSCAIMAPSTFMFANALVTGHHTSDDSPLQASLPPQPTPEPTRTQPRPDLPRRDTSHALPTRTNLKGSVATRSQRTKGGRIKRWSGWDTVTMTLTTTV